MGELARVSKTGQVRIPASIRRRLTIEGGDLLEMHVEDGCLILTPKQLVDKSQAYFWTKEWQEAEREAEDDIHEGRVEAFVTPEALLEDLERP